MEDSNGKFEYEVPDEDEDEDEEFSMTLALEADHKREFLRLMKSPRLQNEQLDMISREIILEAAVKCAAAVLDGETNGLISPNFGFSSNWTVMHEVAVTLSKDFLQTFLQRGFSVNVRSHRNLLPLNVALRSLPLRQYRSSVNFCAGKLLLELICRKARELEFVRLLALNTRDLKDEFFKYAKEGRMVEVGALLLAAGEKLMPLCISEGEDDTPIIFSSFKEISHFLKPKYPWSATNRDDSRGMEETLILLDIYDKIGNQLTPYARPKNKVFHQDPGHDIALLLKEAGSDVNFEYKPRSNISSFGWSGRRGILDCTPQELNKLFYKQPQRPSIPTRQLFHTSSFQNIDSKYASLTPAKKLVKVNQNLNSCKKFVSFLNIFRRGVRLV